MIAPEVCERLHTALHLLFTDFSARRKGDYAMMKIVVAFILATLIAMPALAAGNELRGTLRTTLHALQCHRQAAMHVTMPKLRSSRGSFYCLRRSAEL